MSRSWLIIPLLLLYFLDLGGVGFLGPDEPRYASIGREMARSGDLVTPRLDGQPWFEKSPLLYWLIATGNAVHLPDEWAARLPVAIVSVAFLLFFFYILAAEYSSRIAIAATTILATSAGWIAFSFAAVTDVPLSATSAAALLVTIYGRRRWDGWIAGVLLGLAILAKGLVPLVLFAPVFVFGARGKRLAIIVGALVVAAPWYALCWIRNGNVFFWDFIWKHHVQRFFSPELQHVYPWWFYLPVLLLGLFPWTPLVGLLARSDIYIDKRIRSLGLWFLFELMFFSLSRNKLPGYVLPLLPILAILLAVAVDEAKGAEWYLAGGTASLVLLPVMAHAMPSVILNGLTRTHFEAGVGYPFLAAALLVWWLWRSGHSSLAILAVGLSVLFSVAYIKGQTFSVLDERTSARAFWRAHRNELANSCVDGVRRDWAYELNYYADHPILECSGSLSPGQRKIEGFYGKLTLE